MLFVSIFYCMACNFSLPSNLVFWNLLALTFHFFHYYSLSCNGHVNYNINMHEPEFISDQERLNGDGKAFWQNIWVLGRLGM